MGALMITTDQASGDPDTAPYYLDDDAHSIGTAQSDFSWPILGRRVYR